MWELDYKESWALKNWCFWTVVLEKTLESPLDCKEIKPVNSKGNQSWILIGRTDAEPEAPIPWLPSARNWLIGKDPDAGKDWRWEEKGDDRGWDGWMASLTQWTWGLANSRSWWWIGRPFVLQYMGFQRVRHDWVTELSWTDLMAQMAKNLPEMLETQVWFLGWKNPLEKGIVTPSSILAWRIPWRSSTERIPQRSLVG